MSYNTDLQTNNVNLQAILDTVNNLPEAGGGSGSSGGGSVETCTVTIESFYWSGNEAIREVVAQTVTNGSFSTYHYITAFSTGEKIAIEIPNVVCGSVIHLIAILRGEPYVEVTNGMTVCHTSTLIGSNYGDTLGTIVFTAPTTSGANGLLQFSYEP